MSSPEAHVISMVTKDLSGVPVVYPVYPSDPGRHRAPETEMTRFRHACDIQARCLQSDKLESRCDYVVYNLAAWRLEGKVLLTIVVILAWVPMVRSMQAGAVEEHLLSRHLETLQAQEASETSEASLAFYAAAFHLHLSLRARREALVWSVVTAIVALVASEPPAANSLLMVLGLSLFASADRLWSQLLLGPAAYADLQSKVDLCDVPKPRASEACRGFASMVLMLLLIFHLEEAMRLGSPVLEAWGIGRGIETRLIFTTMFYLKTVRVLS